MSNILDITGLSKRYGGTQALKSVTLSVPEDRIVGLLGPNGSGKTTLIKIVTGLLSNYEGTVSIDGSAPGRQSKAIVSYLPDRPCLPNWMKVSDAVSFFGDFYADFDRTKASAMLRTMKVDENKKVRTLSKGMHEKLQLSLVMSRRARLYVLDEPLAGVDPASRDFILSTILTNYCEKSSILISTHIISDVESIFDDVIFLKEGVVELHGDAESIRTKHQQSIDQLFREVFKC